ncbi:MAG: hypothetical protein NTV86_19750, partial [Planctomycetota bacterium]|nr:hypothetical protein [Planctomycetota bacterium]
VTRRASQTHGNETMDAKEAPTTIVKLIQKECLDMGRNGTAQVAVDDSPILVAYVPVLLGENRHGLAVGHAKSEVAVPLNAHERITYALIAGLVLLYFATGYVLHRGDGARIRMEND